jgi:hypothetical protein
MPASSIPFALPETIERSLARVLSYWQGLKRADNDMPFWDDLKPPALSDQADKLLLIDVFAKPERFRFNFLAKELAQSYGEPLAGKFVDETELRDPFAFLRAQCSATVEARAPTYYRNGAGNQPGHPAGYSRIQLPMWGEGQVRLLLCAVDRR